MLAKKLISLLSWFLIVIAVAGVFYRLSEKVFVLGVFEMGFLYSIFYALAAIYLIISTKKGTDSAKKLAQTYGIIFFVIAIIGFFVPDTIPGQQWIGSNVSTSIFNLVVGGLFFLIGKSKIR